METVSCEDENDYDHKPLQERLNEERLSDERLSEGRLDEDERLDDDTEEQVKFQENGQHSFLGHLGLITFERFNLLQKKRVERKRRSTANPQFIYSHWELPVVREKKNIFKFYTKDKICFTSMLMQCIFQFQQKRKRHSYLQSGNAPQTRQTTARLNGPSPPPLSAKNQGSSTKSTSPPIKSSTKSLIQAQKTSSKPNILRGNGEKLYNVRVKVEHDSDQSDATTKSIGGKALNIPGLPSSVTIERIGHDTAVCTICRNTGINASTL